MSDVRTTHHSSLITHHLRLACGVHPTRRATRRPSIVEMRCCLFVLFLVVVAGAFVAGLLLRDVPAIDALVVQARHTVTGAAAPATPLPRGVGAPAIQQSGR